MFYGCSQRHYKDVIQWNDNDTITYQQRKRWEFIEEESPYSLDEIISNINIIALVSTLIVPRKLRYNLGEGGTLRKNESEFSDFLLCNFEKTKLSP